MNNNSKIYFHNLDGLRFLAFLLVFVNHAFNCLGYRNQSTKFEFFKTNFLENGDLGVSFFFVLSGFLITFLLLKEKDTTGKIKIFNFYIRRILRIWPVYFIVAIICVCLFPLFNNHLPGGFPFTVSIDKLNPYLYFSFLGNFDYLYHGITNVLIGPLWSVSVEEQFYLLWPILIFVTPRKYILQVLTIILIGSVCFRYFYSHGNAMIIKYHSLSCMTYLVMGAMVAEISSREKLKLFFLRIPKYIIVIIYLSLMIFAPFRLYIWKFGKHYELVASLTPIVFSLYFAFIIFEQNISQNSLFKIGNFKKISALGKYTYGMYCYHMPVVFSVLFLLKCVGVSFTEMNDYSFAALFISTLFVTFFVSVFSFHVIENKFLKLKEKFY